MGSFIYLFVCRSVAVLLQTAIRSDKYFYTSHQTKDDRIAANHPCNGELIRDSSYVWIMDMCVWKTWGKSAFHQPFKLLMVCFWLQLWQKCHVLAKGSTTRLVMRQRISWIMGITFFAVATICLPSHLLLFVFRYKISWRNYETCSENMFIFICFPFFWLLEKCMITLSCMLPPFIRRVKWLHF